MKIHIERRKTTSPATNTGPTDLPVDFLKLVNETLAQTFQASLSILKNEFPETKFESGGYLLSDEIVLTATLNFGAENLAATTVYASTDFDPQNTTALEKALPICLDAVGSVFDFYMDPTFPERLKQLTESTLSALDEAPFEWTALEGLTPAVWVKMDKSNPRLDQLTQEWLKKNDPEYDKHHGSENEEEAESFLEERLEALKGSKKGPTSGSLH